MKFYIDEHHSISSDKYMRLSPEEKQYYDTLARKACERDNEERNKTESDDDADMYIKNVGDKLRMISLGDLLCKIQKHIHKEECVLRILTDECVICRNDHDCDKCIQTIINQRLDK